MFFFGVQDHHIMTRIRGRKIFAIMKLAALLALAIFTVVMYWVTFKPEVAMPMGAIRSNYLFVQLIAVLAIAFLSRLSYRLPKTNTGLIRYYKKMVIIGFIFVFVFLGVLIHLGNIYNEDAYAQFYDENLKDIRITSNREMTLEEQMKSALLAIQRYTDINLDGLPLPAQRSTREIFIDENVQAYTYFQFQALLLIGRYAEL
ncbi:MAG: hypothetical protein FWC79_05205 [Oscillospiraceae bacterium]|nr:hypothetical protein [Oscillospiraceae bacterium]